MTARAFLPVAAIVVIMARKCTTIMAAMIRWFRFNPGLVAVDDWIEISVNSLDR
jgi:hypothetical protein